jgi:diaminohydroxyphosphoribosylaminopyrimidine deaminase/5-amino-6-(5-phosphoribosylamino)uracil reductase
MYSEADYTYMAQALRLAKQGLYTTHPNPRVGCVIVNNSEVVGTGYHIAAGGPHAEVHALQMAGEKARGATAYVTLEPCCHHGRTPPCTDALINAGVARVVAAMQDPNPKVAGNGLLQLSNHNIEVAVGLLEQQAHDLNIGFVQRMKLGRPYVRCKLAMSLDGRTAMANGDSKWITSEAARDDVQQFRAQSSAIMTGAGTVLADDPAMTVRLDDTMVQPLRIIIDSNLSTPANAKILQQSGKTIIFTCTEDMYAIEQLISDTVSVIVLEKTEENVDLREVLHYLADKQINEILLETGATLSGAMLAAGLVDEMVIYVAPKLMGDQARGLFKLSGLEKMADSIDLNIKDVRMVGQDLRVTARPIYK